MVYEKFLTSSVAGIEVNKNVFTDVMSMLSSGLDYVLGRTNETTNAVANINILMI